MPKSNKNDIMNKINKKSDEIEVLKSGDEQNIPPLSIFCVDSIEVKARVTFDGCEIDGFQLTNWPDELTDGDIGINSIFDVFFKDMIKSRNKPIDQETITN
jgi:hypothetical protein